MKARDFIGQPVILKINQPMGTRHPICDFIYPINYGYMPTILSGTPNKLYAYVLGMFEPLEIFEGTCIAVIHHLNCTSDILIVVPKGKNYTDAQIDALTEFQEKFFEHTIIR